MFSPSPLLRKQGEFQIELASSAYVMEVGSRRCPGRNTSMHQEGSLLEPHETELLPLGHGDIIVCIPVSA